MVKHPRLPAILTLFVALVIDLLFGMLLFDRIDLQMLFWLLWAPSVVLLPAIYFDGQKTELVSWKRIGGLAIPGVNLIVAIDYLYRRSQLLRNNTKTVFGHGGLYFITLFTGGLAIVILPYLTGLLALVCAFRIRTAHDRREGSLLLASVTVVTFLGLIINQIIFDLVRPGPII